MTAKPKTPAKAGTPAATPRAARAKALPSSPVPQADARWQRTVRYGWDKGGARGGRK